MELGRSELLGAAFTILFGCIFSVGAQSEPFSLNCSRLVRTDTRIGPDGKMPLPQVQIATPYYDAITLVDHVTVDIQTFKLTVLEPGSLTAVDYSFGMSVSDHYVFGKISVTLEDPGNPFALPDDLPAPPLTLGGRLTKIKIVNIDRLTGAFSTSEQLIDENDVIDRLLGKPEHDGKRAPVEERQLGGARHDEAAGGRVPFGKARLDHPSLV